MENLQLGCLLVSLFFTTLTYRNAPNPAQRTFILGLILLHISFLMHEFDPRNWQDSLLMFVFRGVFRNALLAAAWIFGLVVFIRRASSVWAGFIQWLSTRSASLVVISGFFWLMGGAFDKLALLGKTNSRMAEELMETNGALFLLLGVIALYRSSMREHIAMFTPVPTSDNTTPGPAAHQPASAL